MNLFLISWNIEECAQWHFDAHVRKMIIELAQLLSTAHWCLANEKQLKDLNEWHDNNRVYRLTHKNHPCAIWVREHINNYRFTAKLAMALCDEYYYRYGRERNRRHETEKIIKFLMENEPENFTETDKDLIGPHNVTEPAQAMPDDYKDEDVIQAYRNYYLSEEKMHLLSWKNRNIPPFIEEIIG